VISPHPLIGFPLIVFDPASDPSHLIFLL